MFEAVKSDCHRKLKEALRSSLLLNPIYCVYKTDSTTQPEYYRKSLIQYACYKNSHNCVQVLLEAGLSISQKYGKRKFTPLGYACCYNAYESAQILILNGADVNVRCETGKTLFDWISFPEIDSIKFIKLLLRNGFDVKAIDSAKLFGGNYSYTSTVSDKYRQILNILRGSGVEITSEVQKEPASLSHLARSKIRDVLLRNNHPNMFTAVPKLKLPKALEGFLLYNIDISEPHEDLANGAKTDHNRIQSDTCSRMQ